ncbi:SGNH/GDSL hydrolase family protein [Qipengyuania sp.]|uniref:SGNH/GDSL hydrolase family protein n=1 Tax=Qipengyuania sp. TaxID=2004515 RepID=UPI003AF476F1
MIRHRLVAFSAALLMPTLAIAADESRGDWAAAWGYAATEPNPNDVTYGPGTYEYRARLTNSGSAIVLTFENPENHPATTLASVEISLPAAADGFVIEPGTTHSVTFSGRAGAELVAGRALTSDAIEFPAIDGQDVIVRARFTRRTQPGRADLAMPVAFVEDGGQTRTEINARPFLSLISVRDPGHTCTVLAFGDSITDGVLSRSRSIRGWPGRLAERFAAQPADQRCGVVNMGIGGNRVLRDGRGAAALERFTHDVAAVPGVTHLIVLEGINDIGNDGGGDHPTATPESLTQAYQQIIARAHQLGIKVIGGTLTPALHAAYMSPEKERTRVAVNEWIRTSGAFDAVIDFDAAVRDPKAPADLQPAFDPGDHLHPNDFGYRAMGDAIDLDIFK